MRQIWSLIPTWPATPPSWTCIYNICQDPVHQIARGLLQTVGNNVKSSNAQKKDPEMRQIWSFIPTWLATPPPLDMYLQCCT